MNPMECEVSDWTLYFNNTWMHHKTQGTVHISVDREGGLMAGKKKTKAHRVNAQDLECLWPLSTSINYKNYGIYIARIAIVSAKRSATMRHYFVRYPRNQYSMTEGFLRTMTFMEEYPTLNYALKALNQQDRSSIAITNDLILIGRGIGQYEVVCKGEPSGMLKGVDELSFMPLEEHHPFSLRAEARLYKEGILC